MGNEIRYLSSTVGEKANMATTRARLSYNSRSWLDTCRMIGGLCRGGFFVVPWVALTLLSVAIVVIARCGLTLSNETHEDLQVPTEVLTTFGATMSLLLAFRLNVSYQRWWEARECALARRTGTIPPGPPAVPTAPSVCVPDVQRSR